MDAKVELANKTIMYSSRIAINYFFFSFSSSSSSSFTGTTTFYGSWPPPQILVQ
jgi:hypothetical protein